MNGGAARARDWAQFRLLSRTSVRRLLDSALFARDADPMQFALWGLALAATPPAFFAVRQIFLYASLKRVPPDVVERIVLGHRLFFVIYGMLAMALVAALTWEALFPDRDDQEIVGVLPVRPRTLAAARLGAAALVGAVFAAAINVPTAVIYTGVSMMAGDVLWLLLGHVVATMLGCMSVFFALLVVRGLVAMWTGDRATRWIAGILQLVTIILLVEVVFFLPSVLPAMIDSMLDGSAARLPFLPAWFAALYSTIAGTGREAIHAEARLAWLAALAAPAVVVPVYLVPAAWTGRRVLETRSAERSGALTSFARGLAALAIPQGAVRAMFVFTVASLARSRRHALVLATYAGLGIAMTVASLLSNSRRAPLAFDHPEPYWLALPLVMTFFLVFGLRAAMRIPTDLDANWPFRIAQPGAHAAANATAFALVALGVAPMTALALLLALPVWPLVDSLSAAAMHFVSGVLLVECALHGWTRIPFACAHAPATQTLRWHWLLYLIALNLFAFQLSDLQVAALAFARGVLWYVAAGGGAALAIHLWRRRAMRNAGPTFDAPEDVSTEALNLSEALR